MPDRNKLRVGDRIRILTVPDYDLAQREREIATNAEMAGWTADAIERIGKFLRHVGDCLTRDSWASVVAFRTNPEA
jgi:hypothetical protein